MSEPNIINDVPEPGAVAAARRHGFRDGIGVPAVPIFFSMMGFAALAREAGFDAIKVISTTAFVWGSPGQIAAVSLHMAGASLWVVFTAVALANMRMLLMTISGMEMLNLHGLGVGFWKKLVLMQLLAITSWIQLGNAQDIYKGRLLYHYYAVMALMIYIFGILGTVLGFFVVDFLPRDVLTAVLVMTPMYILLMVINARQIIHRYAGVCGGVLCPLAFPVIGEWGILLGGIVGGSIAVILKKKTRLMVTAHD